MGQRSATLRVILAAAAILLAGCTAPADVLLYEHHWTFGPGYGRTDPEGDPLFTDTFEAGVGGTWRVNVTSEMTVGTYRVQLRDPGGFVRYNATRDGEGTLDGVAGRWSIEILTDADGAATPTGRIDVVVTGRA